MPKKLDDLSGKKFNRLTAVSSFKRNERTYCNCICECGTRKNVRLSHLLSGAIKSCGCLCSESAKSRRTTHGKSGSRVFSSWSSMKSRCLNKRTKAYKNYGGRGITVCDRWLESFENFYKDMGDPPTSKHTLDRINNDGNYEPLNCRWATYTQQGNNRRGNRTLLIGNCKYTIAEAAKIFKPCRNTITQRLNDGLSFKQAVGLVSKKEKK